MNKTYKTNSYLFRENDRSRELYIIQSGRIKVFRAVGNREVDIAVLGKGAVLGEMALIDGKPRSASAKAVENASVVVIDADTFHTKVRGVPPWFMTIIRMVSQKIRGANKHLERMQLDKRGINAILALQYYLMRAGGGSLNIVTTRKQLSQLLSITQHRSAYVVDFLQHHGFITVEEDCIRCLDRDTFDEYCSFLRLFVRKSFDRMDEMPEALKNAIMVLGESAKCREGQPCSMHGKDFEDSISQAGIAQECSSLLNALAEMNMVKVKRNESGRTQDSPLSSATIEINSTMLHRHVLFLKYSKAIPSA